LEQEALSHARSTTVIAEAKNDRRRRLGTLAHFLVFFSMGSALVDLLYYPFQWRWWKRLRTREIGPRDGDIGRIGRIS